MFTAGGLARFDFPARREGGAPPPPVFLCPMLVTAVSVDGQGDDCAALIHVAGSVIRVDACPVAVVSAIGAVVDEMMQQEGARPFGIKRQTDGAGFGADRPAADQADNPPPVDQAAAVATAQAA